jgi:hypothetical protein
MIKSKLMPPSSGPAKDWYPNPSGEGFRDWDGREWGEERPAASDAQRGRPRISLDGVSFRCAPSGQDGCP